MTVYSNVAFQSLITWCIYFAHILWIKLKETLIDLQKNEFQTRLSFPPRVSGYYLQEIFKCQAVKDKNMSCFKHHWFSQHQHKTNTNYPPFLNIQVSGQSVSRRQQFWEKSEQSIILMQTSKEVLRRFQKTLETSRTL